MGGEPAAVPKPGAETVYASMVDRYDALERMVIAVGAALEGEEEEDVGLEGGMSGTISVEPLPC